MAHLCAWQFHIFLYIHEDRSLTGLYFVTHFVQFCHKLEWTKQWKYRHQINQRNYILKHLRQTYEIIILCQESTWKHQHFPLPNTQICPKEGRDFTPGPLVWAPGVAPWLSHLAECSVNFSPINFSPCTWSALLIWVAWSARRSRVVLVWFIIISKTACNLIIWFKL